MVVQARQQQKVQNENECNNGQNGNSKKISIDPKTWIKLGHFHLLLEEYKKGENNVYFCFSSSLFICLQHCLPIKCFTKLKRKITGQIRIFSMD